METGNVVKEATLMIFQIILALALCVVILGELGIIFRLLKEFFRVVY